jgi:hypothetical protein
MSLVKPANNAVAIVERINQPEERQLRLIVPLFGRRSFISTEVVDRAVMFGSVERLYSRGILQHIYAAGATFGHRIVGAHFARGIFSSVRSERPLCRDKRLVKSGGPCICCLIIELGIGLSELLVSMEDKMKRVETSL